MYKSKNYVGSVGFFSLCTGGGFKVVFFLTHLASFFVRVYVNVILCQVVK